MLVFEKFIESLVSVFVVLGFGKFVIGFFLFVVLGGVGKLSGFGVLLVLKFLFFVKVLFDIFEFLLILIGNVIFLIIVVLLVVVLKLIFGGIVGVFFFVGFLGMKLNGFGGGFGGGFGSVSSVFGFIFGGFKLIGFVVLGLSFIFVGKVVKLFGVLDSDVEEEEDEDGDEGDNVVIEDVERVFFLEIDEKKCVKF